MGKFDLYKIPLKALAEGIHEFDFVLDSDYFAKIDSLEIQKGNVKAKVVLKKTANVNEFRFDLNGTVLVPCDRCLDEMEQPVSYEGKFFVKFGNDYSQEGDDIIVIPEEEGEINLAWFLFEFVALNIPIKHVHAPGKCNKGMSSKLKKHLTRDENDEDNFGEENFENDENDENDETTTDTDPRWDGLKELLTDND